MKRKEKTSQGVTLITLVVTIIVLLILAGVTIIFLTGERGILSKTQNAKTENEKQTATEIMNLKITQAQITSYSETQKMPDLQYLADRLYEDKEIQYVKRKEKEIATLEPVKIVSEDDSILTKLNAYPYEFEIDSKLRLASIDGVKIADNETSYIELKEEINKLKENIQSQTEEIGKLKQTIQNQETEMHTLKNETILNKRVKLLNAPVEIPIVSGNDTNKDIQLNTSIEGYKYIEIQLDVKWNNAAISTGSGNHLERTVIIAKEQLTYNNSNTVNWTNGSTFGIYTIGYSDNNLEFIGDTAWFKNATTLHLGGACGTNRNDYEKIRIRNIYGIK